MLNKVQLSYATTEKKLLAIIFAFEKFWTYLVGYPTIVYTDHAIIRFLFEKKESKPHLMRWVLLLQDYDLQIQGKNWSKNRVTDFIDFEKGPTAKGALVFSNYI